MQYYIHTLYTHFIHILYIHILNLILMISYIYT